MDKKLSKIIFWLILGIIVLIPSFFVFWQQIASVFVLGKTVFFRLLLSLVAILSLSRLLFIEKFKLVKDSRLWLIFGGLFVAWLLSGLLSLEPVVSWWGDYYRQQGLLSWFYYLLFAWLVIINLKQAGDIKKIGWFMVVGSVLPVIYGLVQWLGLDPFVWGEESNRLLSTIGQPNFFAYYLLLVIPITFYAIYTWSKHSWQRIVLSLLLVGQLWCLFLTYSRGAWVGLLTGVILWLLFWLWYSQRIKILQRLLIIFVLACLLIISNLQLISNQAKQWSEQTSNPFLTRILSVMYLDGGSGEVRFQYWQSVWSEMKTASWQRQLIGYGPDAQNYIFAKHYQPDWALREKLDYYPDRAHNIILDTWLQFGWLGLIFAVIALGYILRLVYLKLKLRDNRLNDWLIIVVVITLLSQLVANMFGFFDIVHSVYWYLLLAVLWLLAEPKLQYKSINLSNLIKLSLMISLSIVIIFFFYIFSWKSYLADSYYRKSQQIRYENCSKSLNFSAQAMHHYPLEMRYKNQYLNYANTCLKHLDRAGQKQLVDNILQQVDALNAYNYPEYESLWRIARTYSLLGYLNSNYYVKSENLYQQMIDYAPGISISYRHYALMKLRSGNPEEAIVIAKQGLENLVEYQNNGAFGYDALLKRQKYRFVEIIADAYWKMNQVDKAKEYYQDIYNQYPAYAKVRQILGKSLDLSH